MAAGGAVVGRDDLADAVCGGVALDAGEEGDGVGELGLGGAVLRGARQGAEPRGDVRRLRRHRWARVLGGGGEGGAFGLGLRGGEWL